MNPKIAFLIVIAIWSTTPLCIQWSGEGVGFRFGVTSRMVLGMVATLIVLTILRGKLPRHRRAVQTYIASGLGIYGAMSLVYWSAQFIPSGWISIIFGLSPLITGILANIFLGEDALAPHKLLGILLGVIGLVITFGEGYSNGQGALLGAVAVLVGTFIHCLSAVTVKKINADLSGLSVTAGGLLVAVPLYLISWFVSQSHFPETIPMRPALSIIYLGTVGTAIGFAMYYYVLKHMEVSRVSLITLITPVCAIALGYSLNGESLDLPVVAGTACILAGLLSYEFGERLQSRFKTAT